MTDHFRRNDSAMSLDLVALDEEDRRACSGQAVTSRDAEAAVTPPQTHRCDDAHRELYRHHFLPR